MRLVLCALLVLASPEPSGASGGEAEQDATWSGGAATVFDQSRQAFTFAVRHLRDDLRSAFFVGNSFFNQNWVAAPASTAARDGLGPLFNTRSCSACHFKDGRGRPPGPGEPMSSMLLRVGIPGTGPHGGPMPDPVYGDQIQGRAVPNVPGEADVYVDWEEISGSYADGETYSLRRPRYRLENPGYGPFHSKLLKSGRVAPAMIGLGLLEAVAEADLRALADPEDADGDGVSGKLNRVWNHEARSFAVGRFGWKAEQPDVRQQVAGAFLGDMGITSHLFRGENHTREQYAALASPSGGDPELGDSILDAVVLYSRLLAVPARRNSSDETVRRGERLFREARCNACHVAELHTASDASPMELAGQTIRPYTDLLLHDLGPGLSDERPSFEAGGAEWRTAPLWGIGLIQTVNGHQFLLHDGRARGFAEAILWHGGEAEPMREAFRRMPRADRVALLAFLQSL
jgi:CxxC motif-containing protein (DUF1111 family)